MNTELTWALKVVRNGFILAGLYFVSVWGSNEELTLSLLKPVLIFVITYILAEYSKRYGLDREAYKPKEERTITTLIF